MHCNSSISDFHLAIALSEANASHPMSIHFDPEGHESHLTDTSALTLTIPADRAVLLYATFDSAWEQAVVLYIDGERYEDQLGSFVLRSNSLVVPKQAKDYVLTLVAWHKRSNANPELPWMPSRGQQIGPIVFAWDDSADDQDYRDVRIKLVTS